MPQRQRHTDVIGFMKLHITGEEYERVAASALVTERVQGKGLPPMPTHPRALEQLMTTPEVPTREFVHLFCGP